MDSQFPYMHTTLAGAFYRSSCGIYQALWDHVHAIDLPFVHTLQYSFSIPTTDKGDIFFSSNSQFNFDLEKCFKGPVDGILPSALVLYKPSIL